MIQDSATIIVLGNKYNRNIYEAKEMEKFFDSTYSPESEGAGEETSSPEPRKAEKRRKKVVSHKKTTARKHTTHHHRK